MVTALLSKGIKQIIVVNDALQMPRNKRSVHIARASMGAFFEAGKDNKRAWIKEGRPKIILNVLDQDDLQDLFAKAEKRKLPVCLVEDETTHTSTAGRMICLGIGPVTETQVSQLVEILDYYRWIREGALNARIQAD